MTATIQGAIIRAAVVRRKELGFIIAGDSAREEADELHTLRYMWKAGELTQTEANYEAHTLTIVERPGFGVLQAAKSGDYSIETMDGVASGNIFDLTSKTTSEPRYGQIKALSTVDGTGYAVGFRGMAYRMDAADAWTRIDHGLPATFDAKALDGFSSEHLYAVGLSGQLWTLEGNNWQQRTLPTNVHLNCVKCVSDVVYIGGYKGVLLRGAKDSWTIVEHDAIKDNIWDIDVFDNSIYVSTMKGVYLLAGDSLIPVDFGDDGPTTTNELDAAADTLWSIGARDIFAFDGTGWQRIL